MIKQYIFQSLVLNFIKSKSKHFNLNRAATDVTTIENLISTKKKYKDCIFIFFQGLL